MPFHLLNPKAQIFQLLTQLTAVYKILMDLNLRFQSCSRITNFISQHIHRNLVLRLRESSDLILNFTVDNALITVEKCGFSSILWLKGSESNSVSKLPDFRDSGNRSCQFLLLN